MSEIKLARGDAGLEVHDADGNVIGHICHTADVGAVLDFLLNKFPVQTGYWVYLKAQAELKRQEAKAGHNPLLG